MKKGIETRNTVLLSVLSVLAVGVTMPSSSVSQSYPPSGSYPTLGKNNTLEASRSLDPLPRATLQDPRLPETEGRYGFLLR
jgi:hypothetical protein